MKSVLKQIIPPFLVGALKQPTKYGWFGNYSSWQEAQNECTGYDSTLILDRIKKAALHVQKGEAKFERDGTLFYREDYNWHLISSLMMAAAGNKGILHVTDFGGSLGSSYFQHKALLSGLAEVKWCIIEQKHFVDFGREHLQSRELCFTTDVSGCLRKLRPQVLILSSVLQYLEKPFEIIDYLLSFCYRYIFIDRTAFTREKSHEITVQRVNPAIYRASYPSWFFNENIFLRFFLANYELVASFENDDFTNKKNTYFKGFLLRMRNGGHDEN